MHTYGVNIVACSLYNSQWHGAQLELSHLLEVEKPAVPDKPEKV